MSHPDEMSCAEAEPLLPLVADGALDPDSDPSLFAHLAACPACQRVVAQHDLIGLAIRQAGPVPERRPARIIRLLPFAAAACVAVAAGLWLAADRAPAPAPAIPVAVQTPVAPVQPTAQVAIAAEKPAMAPEVIALRREDGTAVYLVRQGENWTAVDPAAMDGPTQPSRSSGSGVQVRY